MTSPNSHTEWWRRDSVWKTKTRMYILNNAVRYLTENIVKQTGK